MTIVSKTVEDFEGLSLHNLRRILDYKLFSLATAIQKLQDVHTMLKDLVFVKQCVNEILICC
jgi:hypothetical protein